MELEDFVTDLAGRIEAAARDGDSVGFDAKAKVRACTRWLLHSVLWRRRCCRAMRPSRCSVRLALCATRWTGTARRSSCLSTRTRRRLGRAACPSTPIPAAVCSATYVQATRDVVPEGRRLDDGTATTLEGLFFVLDLFLKSRLDNKQDYRYICGRAWHCALSGSRLVFEHKRSDFGGGKPELKASMGLWNMNPAAGFQQMAHGTRAVLLASGRGSPTACA